MDAGLITEAFASLPQFSLRHSQTLDAALVEINSASPDVILLDLELGKNQGLETLAKLRESAPRCPVVVLTSRDDEELGLSALHAGAQDYLVKTQFAAPYVRRSIARSLIHALERSRAEESLRQSHSLLNAVIQGISDAVFVKDRAGKYVVFNQAASRLVGKPVAEVLGHDDTAIFDRESARTVMDRDRRVMEAGREETEEEVLTAGGLTRVYLATKCPYRDRRGNIIGVIGISRDITGQKEAEAAARAAEQRLQHVLASSPAVLFTLGIEDYPIQGLTWVSDNLVDVFGYPPEAAHGSEWWLGNVHPEDLRAITAQTEAELFTLDRTTHEYRFRHRDGSYCWTRGDIRLIRDATGKPVEAVGSWTDVSEQKRIEEQLHQAQKMDAVGALAGGIAHDFNNLLTVVIGYSELGLDRLPADALVHRMLSEIQKAGLRGSSLTRQLLAFSRQQVVEPKVLDLNEVVSQIEPMLRRLIGEDILLATVQEPGLGLVNVDPGQIEQVVMNLAVNARDAMPQGGRLTIETRRIVLDENYARAHPGVQAGRYAMLALTDTGTGMDPATRARAFEPFFTTKERGKGTGLGLAVVHSIVNQNRGHIQLYSELGHGTSVKLYFHLVDAAPSGEAETGGAATMPRGTETVLLVEDEPAVRALARELLTTSGYTVLAASNGREAIRLAEAYDGPIDLMVSDVVMPYFGGRQLAERLQTVKPGVKVLFISGYTDDAVVRHGVLQAEFAFLHKPFRPAAFARKVREVLDQEQANPQDRPSDGFSVD